MNYTDHKLFANSEKIQVFIPVFGAHSDKIVSNLRLHSPRNQPPQIKIQKLPHDRSVHDLINITSTNVFIAISIKKRKKRIPDTWKGAGDYLYEFVMGKRWRRRCIRGARWCVSAQSGFHPAERSDDRRLLLAPKGAHARA